MNSVYKNFFRNLYLKTGGFLPTKPINQNIYPGDFFQIKNGQMIVLGNIYRSDIVSRENHILSSGDRLNGQSWKFKHDVTKPYSGEGAGDNNLQGPSGFTKQILAFNSPGSHFFYGEDPESVRILNWSDIHQELIVKLTQTYYTFRDVYLVTECATLANWTLAISSSETGELIFETNSKNLGILEGFGHYNSKTIQSKDIEYYHREPNRKPAFFKAKKLAVHDDKFNDFINELMNQNVEKNNWVSDFFDYDFYNDSVSVMPDISVNTHISTIDMLKANELNPNSALLYFKWIDANLDDIEKLFQTYDNQ
ncbi:MAG: hypothetical protein EVB11_03130 [Winogradskyella sp.]|nr:MAG: hypothetical protein EVB11_03130 [Winogradskyella sp.]